MNARRKWRSLGFAMLGLIAVLCLVTDGLIWWLLQQPMAVQTSAFSFVIDLNLVRKFAWGVLLAQPALVSVYLAYGNHNCFARVVVSVSVCLLGYTANLIGWWLTHDSNSFVFIRQSTVTELAVLFAAQAVGFSLAMWLTRIMRGWHLRGSEDLAEPDRRPVQKIETINELTVLTALSLGAIYGPEWLNPDFSNNAGLINFAFFGLVGTLVLAPLSFIALRYRSFVLVGFVLLILIVALPILGFGVMTGLSPGSNGPSRAEYEDALMVMLSSGAIVAALFISIRLAGLRLVSREFPKKEPISVPVDPFSD